MVLVSSGGRSIDEIYAVGGDGFFSQDSLQKWGLSNAKYICDHWHLFNKILPERFAIAKGTYEIIEPHLRSMAEAFTEDYFKKEYKAVIELLRTMSFLNRQVEAEVHKFAMEAPTYAVFHLNRIRGSIGRKGSTSSESNHSSVLTYLNDGLVGINKYCDYPHELIKKLFDRQGEHINKLNTTLNKQTEQLRIEHYRQVTDKGDQILIDASDFKLAYQSYQDFKIIVKKSKSLHCKEELDNESGNTVWNVYRYGDGQPVQTFRQRGDPCSGCPTCIAHLMMCEYCIVEREGKFDLKYFDIRHHYRSQVETSLRQRQSGTDIDNDESTGNDEAIEFLPENNNIRQATTVVELPNTSTAIPETSSGDVMSAHSSSAIRKSNSSQLSPKELMTLFGQVVGNKAHCSEEVKTFIDGMAISLHHLVRDGKQYIKDGDGDGESASTLDASMKDIVQRYKSSFGPGLIGYQMTGTGSVVNSTVVQAPRLEVLKKQSKIRLKAAAEVPVSKKARIGTAGPAICLPARVRKARKCSYCGHSVEPRHRIESCPLRSAHVLGCSNHVTRTAVECEHFITRMRENMPIYNPIKDIVLVTNALLRNGNTSSSNARHVQVRGCYAKHTAPTGYGVLEPREMFFNISIVGPTGIIVEGDNGIHIDGTELYSFVTILQNTKGNNTDSLRSARYIYDHTYNIRDEKCMGRIKN